MGLSATLALLGICVAQAVSGVSKDRYGEMVIPNYWEHIKQVLAAEKLKEEQTPPNVSVRFPPPKEYPFESFRHLTSKELLRAAEEATRAARRETRGQPAAVTDRQIYAYIRTCMEYYPVIAANREDFEKLVAVIRDPGAEKMFRLFIMERMEPGRVPPSAFASYIQDNIQRDNGSAREALGRVGASGADKPEVHALAIELFFNLEYANFMKIFSEDENVKRMAAETGAPVSPRALIDGSLTLSARGRNLMTDVPQRMTDLAQMAARHLEAGSVRNIEVRRAARNVVQRIYDEMPVVDRDAVKAILDAHPPESLSQ